MDHKAWPWRKRSNEKTAIVRDKTDTSFKGNADEGLISDKELETSMKSENEKLMSVVCNCNAKDELVKKHVNLAQEAIEGKERAKAEAVYLKQELSKALQQGLAAEEKLIHLDSELMKCIRELGYVQKEQESRVHGAVMETRRELEKAQRKLEEKLADTSGRLESLVVENTHLSKTLLVKERLIDDLIKYKSQADAEFSALMSRLDSTEKENSFLRYEFHMLEKEVEIRNEERDFTRRSAEASQKQHLESVKKIGKLEAECQRLRILLRKRLPGPAALAKIKSEVKIVGRDQTETRRQKLNPMTGGLVVRDPILKKSHEISNRNISFLVEQLCEVEGENKALKEIITKKTNDLDFSRTMCAQATTKLTKLESQVEEFLKDHKSMELAKCCPISNEPSRTSAFYVSKGDDAKSSRSCASALVSEFRSGKSDNLPESQSIEVSDIRLMDDFVEMEKLAIVSVDTPFSNSLATSHEYGAPINTLLEACTYNSETMGKELVPVTDSDYHSSDMKQEMKTKDGLNVKSNDWLQDVLKAILDQNHVSKRSFEELIEDIRIVVAYLNHPSPSEADAVASSGHLREPDPLYITWRSPNASQMEDLPTEASSIHVQAEKTSSQHSPLSLFKSIGRIIELIEGICQTSSVEHNMTRARLEGDQGSFTPENSVKTADYLVRVFQWKSPEISDMLQQFVQACNDLLKGESNFEKFTEELTSALDWAMKNCITCQDISSVRDKIRKHFDGDKSQNGIESSDVSIEQSALVPPIASSDGQDSIFLREVIRQGVPEENRVLKVELNNRASNKKDLGERLHHTVTEKNDALMIKLQESEESIGILKREVKNLKESKRATEDQIESHKTINEDLVTQLTVGKMKLNEVLQKLSSLEVELEDKSNCCEELEATCLELQLQLESCAKKDIPVCNVDQEEKQLQNGLEVTAASMKLAECQETILNLGKQLKALASPREAALFDKVFSTASTTKYINLSKRATLLDQMNAEDDVDVLKSPKIKEIISNVDMKKPPIQSGNCDTPLAPILVGEPPKASPCSKENSSSGAAWPLAIVQSKKQRGSGGFLRKLLLRRKRGKKASKSFAP